MNLLIHQFVEDYQRRKEMPTGGPDPSAAELDQIATILAKALGPLRLIDLDPAERDDLKGKRSLDLLDTMMETAAALRDCPQIVAAIQTDPAIFERVAQQDVAAGGLINTLQTLSGTVSANEMIRCADADRLCEEILSAVKTRTASLAPPQEPAIDLTDIFATAIATREEGLGRPRTVAAATRSSLREHTEALAEAAEQTTTLENIRALVEDALTPEPQTAKKPGRPSR